MVQRKPPTAVSLSRPMLPYWAPCHMGVREIDLWLGKVSCYLQYFPEALLLGRAWFVSRNTRHPTFILRLESV